MNSVKALGLAVLLALGLIIGFGRYRDSRKRERATVAETKLAAADSVAAVRADTAAAKEPAHQRTGHALAEVLHRAPIGKPRVSTGKDISSDSTAPAAQRDSTQYVTLASYNVLRGRLDSTTTAARNYQAAAEDVIAAQKALIEAQTNVIVSAKNVIANPKPSSRWSVAVTVGPGFAYTDRDKVVTFAKVTANVGLSYRLFGGGS